MDAMLRLRLGLLVLSLFSASAAAAPPRAQGDDAPDQERTQAAPSRPLDAAALRAVHMDLLGRPPYAAERAEWLGKDRAALVGAVLGAEEFWERWTEEQLYYFLLIDNFRPHSDRVLALPADLQARRIGVREAIHRIALSASFDQRNPGPDTFVTVVMEQLLGITVQKEPRELEIGKRLYDGKDGLFLGRKGSSQADVVRIAIEDRGFLTELLRREHRRLLRVEPAGRDLAAWTKRLGEEPLAFAPLVREWLLSADYDRRLGEKIQQPNRLYVRAMVVDLMDRLPEPDEQRRMRNALDGLSDPGPLRAVLARLLLDSGTTAVPRKDTIENPTEWVGGLFQRLLGRPAEAGELKTFVTAFHDPVCRPETVVYALVYHPEYSTY
jgi:hypothetical protein